MSYWNHVRPRPRKPVRQPLERADCPACGREVPCTYPRDGDGSGRRIRRHLLDGERCPGTGRIVTLWRDPSITPSPAPTAPPQEQAGAES